MVFSSFVFLFIFLPIILLAYYLINPRFRNLLLLAGSLLFYSWGDIRSVPILLLSIIANYIFAVLIDKYKGKAVSKFVMISMLICNISLLFAFKYLAFTIGTAVRIIPGLQITAPQWSMPLGISFFTFSAISYVLDVYFQSAKAEKNILNVALYITFFPKMISGPIVKWNSFQNQLENRKMNIEIFSDGVQRFIIGFGKKVIISDSIGIMADKAFNIGDFSDLTVVMAWFGVIAYLIQLYFDFSGYSDMAIGIGKMFGFEIDENFNYPYMSKSIAEFWARWHITLGTWIKHYIYTPVFRNLSKKKNKKTGKKYAIKTCDYVALIVSWLIIGPWHGAGIKFIVYGIYNCFFIILERMYDSYKKKRAKEGRPVKSNFFIDKVLPHLYFLVVIIFGQMMFRSNNMISTYKYLLAMFGLAGNRLMNPESIFIIKDNIVLVLAAVILSFPVVPKIKQYSDKNVLTGRIYTTGYFIALMLIFIISVCFASISTYNPFIYFNF